MNTPILNDRTVRNLPAEDDIVVRLQHVVPVICIPYKALRMRDRLIINVKLQTTYQKARRIQSPYHIALRGTRAIE